MRCTEVGLRLLAVSCLVWVGGCINKTAAPAPAPAPAAPQPAATPAAPAPATPTPAAAPAAPGTPATPGTAGTTTPRAPRYVQLGPPDTPRNLTELRLQMAKRLIAAHPDTSYTKRAPDRLWAIPVLEIELNADGSVKNVAVLRKPTTGDECTQLAIAAVRRAGPYGNVSRLPKPWKVVETFLFDDDFKFKPRTLD